MYETKAIVTQKYKFVTQNSCVLKILNVIIKNSFFAMFLLATLSIMPLLVMSIQEQETMECNYYYYTNDWLLQEMISTLKVFQWKIFLSTIITLSAIISGVVLLRNYTILILLVTISLTILIFSLATIALLLQNYSVYPKIFGGLLGLIALGLFFTAFYLQNEIMIVSNAYKKSVSCIFTMPLLNTLPILITILKMSLIKIFQYTVSIITTKFNSFEIILGLIFYTFFTITWIICFFLYCQQVYISGATNFWIHKNTPRAKNMDGIPFKAKFLEPIALGSLLLAASKISKEVMQHFTQNRCARFALYGTMRVFESLIQCILNFWLVEIVLGEKRSLKTFGNIFRIINANRKLFIAFRIIGTTSILVIQIMVLLTATAISYIILYSKIEYIIEPLTVIFVINLFLMSVSFEAIKIAADTIFVFLCKDNMKKASK